MDIGTCTYSSSTLISVQYNTLKVNTTARLLDLCNRTLTEPLLQHADAALQAIPCRQHQKTVTLSKFKDKPNGRWFQICNSAAACVLANCVLQHSNSCKAARGINTGGVHICQQGPSWGILLQIHECQQSLRHV